MKKGIYTSEFWINLVGVLGGVIISAVGESQWATIAGGLLAAICGSSYTVGRSVLKGKEALGAAHVAAAAAAKGKKSSAS